MTVAPHYIILLDPNRATYRKITEYLEFPVSWILNVSNINSQHHCFVKVRYIYYCVENI